MRVKNKNILIIGMGESGKSACTFLKQQNAKIFLYDDKEEVRQKLKNQFPFCVVVDKVDGDFLQNIDLLVLSPGVSIYCEVCKLAMLIDVKIISELQLGLEFARGRTIAITGTNGKTTTVNLIEQIFNYSKKRNVMVGNVGNPITSFVSRFRTNYICEVSSFQLESSEIKPNIACILNLSQNHLDRHFSFKQYAETKFKIFKNMTRRDFLVLNYDDVNLKKLQSKQTEIFGEPLEIKPKIVWFSQKEKVNGAYVKNDEIWFNDGTSEFKVCNLKDIKLLGNHNVYNVLASVCVALLSKIKLKYIVQAIKSFSGVEHRIQYFLTKNGVDYFNDSKSTTPDSTKIAVKVMKKPIILILGGSDKGLNYDDLALYLRDKVKFTILTGEISSNLERSFKKAFIKNYCVIKDFYEASKYATKIASKGDCVLLSPATASFDCFKNFEQRGEVFMKIINEGDFNFES